MRRLERACAWLLAVVAVGAVVVVAVEVHRIRYASVGGDAVWVREVTTATPAELESRR